MSAVVAEVPGPGSSQTEPLWGSLQIVDSIRGCLRYGSEISFPISFLMEGSVPVHL